jgi:hypothetical protein
MTTRTQQADTIEQQFVVHEHREITQHLARLGEVAQASDRLSVPDFVDELNVVLHWLEATLEPHAAWEEVWLHPRLEEFAGTKLPIAMLTFQHLQIRDRIEVLKARRDAIVAQPIPSRARDLPGRLYGLEAVIRMHLECEDRLIGTLLDGSAPPAAKSRRGRTRERSSFRPGTTCRLALLTTRRSLAQHRAEPPLPAWPLAHPMRRVKANDRSIQSIVPGGVPWRHLLHPRPPLRPRPMSCARLCSTAPTTSASTRSRGRIRVPAKP